MSDRALKQSAQRDATGLQSIACDDPIGSNAIAITPFRVDCRLQSSILGVPLSLVTRCMDKGAAARKRRCDARTASSFVPEPGVSVPDDCTNLRYAAKAPTKGQLQKQQGVARKRNRSREQLHLIYPDPEPEAALQARELMALAVASNPSIAGAWIPASHLARLYREHRRAAYLPRLPWVALARHLKTMAPKRLWKRTGRRRVCYRMPPC
jgi:hypothetical protein